MKVLIIEDEKIASRQLKKMLQENDPAIEVVEELDSVLDATNYLSENNPDLVFLDIQLSDGICFEIFEKIEVDVPIIFITAYDEYMQKAFKVNSIDYLLKPVRQEELDASLNKFRKFNKSDEYGENFQLLFQQFIDEKKAYKHRFMVKSGRGFVSIKVKDIAYFTSENKLNYIITCQNQRFIIDYTLEQLEKILNPESFIKINRNYIISDSCITRVEPYFNNRLLVTINPTPDAEVLVSRNYLKNFKKWMDM